MRRKIIKIIAVICAVVLIFASGVFYVQNLVVNKMMKNTSYSFRPVSYESQNFDSSSHFSSFDPIGNGYAKAAETDTLILYVSDDNRSIKVYDKRTGKTWDSIVPAEELKSKKVNDYYRNMMSSLFKFTYIDLSNTDIPSKEVTLNELTPDISKNTIKNGVRLNFSFKNLGIQLSIEFKLINDQLICDIPDQYFKENDKAADQNTARKTLIQKKIVDFQKMTDDMQKQVAKQNLDSTYQDIVRISVNDIYDLLVKVKQSAGTENYDVRLIPNIQDDISTMESALSDNTVIIADVKKMEQQINDIMKDIQYLLDNKTAGIVDISLMPYFGSATKDVNGYAFYPDLNGAISYFNKSHADIGESFEENVYDIYSPNEKTIRSSSDNPFDVKAEETGAYYPVFGIKQDTSAYVGYITQGDYDSSICFAPISSAVYRANVYSKFLTRKIISSSNQDNTLVRVYDKKRNRQNMEVRYQFLANDQADYSGMANAYRDYLVQNGLLKKSKLMDGQMPLTADFYMGLESSQSSVLRNYIKMTGWSDVNNYLIAANKAGIPISLIDISNWTKHAGNKSLDSLIAASELGGKGSLNSLNETAKKQNSVISMDLNLIAAKSDDLSFLVNNYATAKSMNTLTVNNNNWVLLNPFYIYNQNTINIKKLKQLGCNGITYQDLSSDLYYDYNSQGYSSRQTTAAIFSKIVDENKKQVPYSVQKHAILPYMSDTDWNMAVPDSGSGYFFTDESVPFYQIVMHGYICYTASPLNEASDIQHEKLKRLEYGELPFYGLTEGLPSEIQLEYVPNLFSTKLSDWQSYAFNDYKEYSGLVSTFWNKPILKHEKLEEGVYETTFEGGSKVYVNYNTEDVIVDQKTIKANNFIIVK